MAPHMSLDLPGSRTSGQAHRHMANKPYSGADLGNGAA